MPNVQFGGMPPGPKMKRAVVAGAGQSTTRCLVSSSSGPDQSLQFRGIVLSLLLLCMFKLLNPVINCTISELSPMLEGLILFDVFGLGFVNQCFVCLHGSFSCHLCIHSSINTFLKHCLTVVSSIAGQYRPGPSCIAPLLASSSAASFPSRPTCPITHATVILFCLLRD